MYTSFLCLEDDFFVTRNQMPAPLSYFALNNQDAKDSDIERSINDIVDSLFAMCVTLGTVPVIRCSRRNAAESIAKQVLYQPYLVDPVFILSFLITCYP